MPTCADCSIAKSPQGLGTTMPAIGGNQGHYIWAAGSLRGEAGLACLACFQVGFGREIVCGLGWEPRQSDSPEIEIPSLKGDP